MASGSKTNKNRKYGRWSRSPSNKAYVSEGRKEKNKKKRIARDQKRKLKAEEKLIARFRQGKPVPQRFIRRHGFSK